MPKYDYHALSELAWFLLAAGLPPILAALVSFEPEKIQNWQTWAISLAAASIRAIAGAGLAWFGKQATATRA